MPSAQLSEAQLQALSEQLKSTRERRGDNLADAAFKIALSPSQLRAIEAADLRPFYSTGYFMQAVERYANYLGVSLPEPEPEPVPTVTSSDDDDSNQPDNNPSEAIAIETKAEKVTVAGLHADSAAPTPQSTQTAQSLQDNVPLPDVPPSDVPQEMPQQKSRGVSWGWVAFAIAGLIALGIIKESLEPPVVRDPAAGSPQSESSPATADGKENEKAESSAATTTATAAPAATAGPTASTPPVAPAAASNPVSAGSPATASGTTSSTASPSNTTVIPKAPTSADGLLEVQSSTWVQIVKNNGEKTNLKAEPGQKVEFSSAATAAIVFGQPEKARLTIRGKAVNLSPFITQDTPPRALVIISQIRD